MHPHEISPHLQDLVFGKAQPGPVFIEILELRRNLHHDRILLDVLTSEATS